MQIHHSDDTDISENSNRNGQENFGNFCGTPGKRRRHESREESEAPLPLSEMKSLWGSKTKSAVKIVLHATALLIARSLLNDRG